MYQCIFIFLHTSICYTTIHNIFQSDLQSTCCIQNFSRFIPAVPSVNFGHQFQSQKLPLLSFIISRSSSRISNGCGGEICLQQQLQLNCYININKTTTQIPIVHEDSLNAKSGTLHIHTTHVEMLLLVFRQDNLRKTKIDCYVGAMPCVLCQNKHFLHVAKIGRFIRILRIWKGLSNETSSFALPFDDVRTNWRRVFN